MSRIAFLTLVFARSHDVPPRRSIGGLRRARVLLHEVEPLDRNEQLVFAGVAQLEELLRCVADADLLQADEHADAVVDVDDEIADLEVAKIGEERLRRRSPPLGRAAVFFEDVRLGVNLQPGVRQAESTRQAADRHQHRRVTGILGALDRNREDVVFLQQLDGPFGAARRGRHEQRGFAVLAAPADIGDPVGDPAFSSTRRLALDRRRCSPTRWLACSSSTRRAAARLASRATSRDSTRSQSAKSSPGGAGRSFLAQGFLVAVLKLLEAFGGVRLDFVALGHDDPRLVRP